MTQPIWQTSRFAIDLTQPKVMGIVNLTPDSFSDGGRHSTLSIALENAQTLLAQGADILDIGGESSRPGAEPVSVEEELKRVLPFLQEALTWNVPISVDTYKPEVMQAALDLGADVVNDIWALRQAGALQVVARHPQCGVCLMHMQGDPRTMQEAPAYGNVVAEVHAFLITRAAACTAAPSPSARCTSACTSPGAIACANGPPGNPARGEGGADSDRPDPGRVPEEESSSSRPGCGCGTCRSRRSSVPRWRGRKYHAA